MSTPRLLRHAALALAPLLAACGATAVTPSDLFDGGPSSVDAIDVPRPIDHVAVIDHPDVPVVVEAGRDVVLDTGPFMSASHVPFPQVPANGGPTLRGVQLVVITFPGYDYATQVEAMGRWIVGSDWYATVGRDYGVGPGTFVRHVTLASPAPTRVNDGQIDAFLSMQIASHALPPPTPETLYAIFYPRTTTITGDVGRSCQDYGGYHLSADTATPPFSYAVIPSCPDTGSSLSELDYVELAFAHELIEAATDATPLGSAGYQLTDMSSSWAYLGGEVADLCVTESTTEMGFTLQRVWSNSAARLGNVDPCIPEVPGEVYFNVAANPTEAQVVMPGQTLHYALTGFSSAPISDWYVAATPAGGMFYPTASIDHRTMNNGRTATLTVQIPPDATSGTYGLIAVVSSRTPGVMDLNGVHLWPVAFVVP